MAISNAVKLGVTLGALATGAAVGWWKVKKIKKERAAKYVPVQQASADLKAALRAKQEAKTEAAPAAEPAKTERRKPAAPEVVNFGAQPEPELVFGTGQDHQIHPAVKTMAESQRQDIPSLKASTVTVELQMEDDEGTHVVRTTIPESLDKECRDFGPYVPYAPVEDGTADFIVEDEGKYVFIDDSGRVGIVLRDGDHHLIICQIRAGSDELMVRQDGDVCRHKEVNVSKRVARFLSRNKAVREKQTQQEATA